MPAPPFNAFVGYRIEQFVTFINRPDLNTNVPLYLKDATLPGGRRVNPATLANAPVTRQGTLGRNALRAFPLYQTDVALRREFKIKNTLRLQLRAEAFNVFNRANFGYDSFNQTVRNVTPTGTIQNLNFGLSTSVLSHRQRFNARLQSALHGRRAALDGVCGEDHFLGTNGIIAETENKKAKNKNQPLPFVSTNGFSFS